MTREDIDAVEKLISWNRCWPSTCFYTKANQCHVVSSRGALDRLLSPVVKLQVYANPKGVDLYEIPSPRKKKGN